LYSGAGFTQIAVRDSYYASGDDALVMGLLLSGSALDTSGQQPWRP
jgi:ribosomal protein S18 acetylase RimI-like enzyme